MASSSNRIPNLVNPLNIFNLFTPIKDYLYFEQYSDYGFNDSARTYDNHNAWWLAELSSLVYHDEDFVRKQVKQVFAIDDNRIAWLHGTQNDTQCLVIELTNCFIIVFRGTEFYTPSMLTWSRLRSVRKDLITDLDVHKKEDVILGTIPVHSGFHDALQEIWNSLEDNINTNNKSLFLTGHSMGGAISTLAAMRLVHRVKGLYTYGMPCIGGEEASAYCAQHFPGKCFRHVNDNDFVVFFMQRFLSGFQHVGLEKIIKLKKHNSPYEFLGDAFRLDIIDHSPLFYMLGTRLAL